MKYDAESSLREVLRRGRRLREKRRQRMQAFLSAAAVFTVVLLGAVLHLFGKLVPVKGETSVYGAFLLQQEAGGYVLVGVICFAAAALLTLAMVRHREKSGKNGESDIKAEERES